MQDLQKMRASDADREEVVERLRAALDEGRLKMDEYLERMVLLLVVSFGVTQIGRDHRTDPPEPG